MMTMLGLSIELLSLVINLYSHLHREKAMGKDKPDIKDFCLSNSRSF